MTTPAVLYTIRASLEGQLLGLDNTQAATPLGDYSPYLMGRDFRGLRLFPAGKTGFVGSDYKMGAPFLHNDVFDDFLGAAVSSFWNSLKGSDGTAASAIAVATNGIYRLTSGAGATHTMAVNGAQITTAKTNLVSDGGTRFEVRLGNISALTSQSICFGLVDVSTLSAPFTISGTTITGNGTNGVAFVEDSAATGAAAKLNAVAINAGGTVQSVNLGIDVDTAALHTYRIEVDALGNATYYVDGALVATISLAVATTAVLCPSVGMFSNATSASQTLDIDYIITQSTRV
jgi:hypothetical protein